MTDIALVKASIRPLPSGQVTRFNAGEALELGEFVYISADDTVKKTVGTALATASAVGVVVGVPDGKESAITGEAIDVLWAGEVTGFIGMTAGDALYVSAVNGNIADALPAATNFIYRVGVAKNATTILVQTWTYDVAVVV